jgi:cytochrome c oxidase cbb3-type subunit 3
LKPSITYSAALLALAWSPLQAQHGSTTKNPFDTDFDRTEGSRMFRRQCAACHGPDGSGGAVGPSLTTGAFKRGDSDDSLFQTITKGIPGSNMPAFPGSGREAWQLVAYVRSISVAQATKNAKGDATHGARVYETSGCSNCHAIGDKGGDLGPDLTTVTAIRSATQLRRSILDPASDIPPDYWQLRARTKSGATISGIRMNEDTFSYQYRDTTGLRSVLKSDLAEHQVINASIMPSYQGKLNDKDLEDLIAFLGQRREGSAR